MITQGQFFEISEIFEKHKLNFNPTYNGYIQKCEIQEFDKLEAMISKNKRSVQNQVEFEFSEATETFENAQDRTSIQDVEPFMLKGHYPKFSEKEFKEITNLMEIVADLFIRGFNQIRSFCKNYFIQGHCGSKTCRYPIHEYAGDLT